MQTAGLVGLDSAQPPEPGGEPRTLADPGNVDTRMYIVLIQLLIQAFTFASHMDIPLPPNAPRVVGISHANVANGAPITHVLARNLTVHTVSPQTQLPANGNVKYMLDCPCPTVAARVTTGLPRATHQCVRSQPRTHALMRAFCPAVGPHTVTGLKVVVAFPIRRGRHTTGVLHRPVSRGVDFAAHVVTRYVVVCTCTLANTHHARGLVIHGLASAVTRAHVIGATSAPHSPNRSGVHIGLAHICVTLPITRIGPTRVHTHKQYGRRRQCTGAHGRAARHRACLRRHFPSTADLWTPPSARCFSSRSRWGFWAS